MKMITYGEGTKKNVAHDFHVGNCIWQTPTECGVATQWSSGSIASMTFRASNDLTGWLYGRLGSPSIKVSKFNSNLNEVTVAGEPLTVQGSAPKVEVNSISKSLLNVITENGRVPLRSDSGYVWQLEPNSGNLDWFNAWQPYTQDKADGLTDYWNIKSIPDSGGNSCLKSKSKLVGLVTSNSIWYSGQPPAFEKGFLKYKVAGLHYLPDGKTPFLGTYDLVIASKNARCLYGFTSAPISATVSVTSAGGAKKIATTTMTEKNGWIRFSAKAFTFSSPTIKIKITQPRGSRGK
jgi:hypothetical protein